MKNLNTEEFLFEAGAQMTFHRDMSYYNEKSFQCACGSEHDFYDYMNYSNFGTSGINAKMIVTCPKDPKFSTLIKTKYKLLVVFDKFISLAGCKTE